MACLNIPHLLFKYRLSYSDLYPPTIGATQLQYYSQQTYLKTLVALDGTFPPPPGDLLGGTGVLCAFALQYPLIYCNLSAAGSSWIFVDSNSPPYPPLGPSFPIPCVLRQIALNHFPSPLNKTYTGTSSADGFATVQGSFVLTIFDSSFISRPCLKVSEAYGRPANH